MTLVLFIIFHLIGGDPSYAIGGKNATAEQIENIREQLGINRPLLSQYFEFLHQSFTLDWGRSWSTDEKISDVILQRVGPTLSLTLPAFFISFLISLFLALLSTFKKDSPMDQVISFSCLMLMGVSFLTYIILLQYLLAFHWDLFYVSGWDSSWLGRWQYLFLPWIISIIVMIGPSTLIYRTAIFDEVLRDYVTTAKAKGLNRWAIHVKHVLKNAMIPIITILVMQMPLLILGSLLLESFFSIPGLGSLLKDSIQTSDLPTIKAITVIGTLMYIGFNLIGDIAYQLVDPRVNLK